MAGWIRIADDGSVQIDDETRQALAGREFTLLVAPTELLLGAAAEPGRRIEARALLAGNLLDVAFPEIVSLIAHTRSTGVMRILSASATRRVLFVEGEVRGASSDRVGERLNEIMVRLGLLKDETMMVLCREAESSHETGRLAVERGLITERDLWNAVQEHVTTIFQAILLESRGSFVLAEEAVEDAITVPGLSAAGLLMEGVRRLDELRVRSSPGGDVDPERVLASFNGAFRDIFATADRAGAGEALRRAAASVFEDDPATSALRGVAFTATGDLPEREVLEGAARAAAERELTAAAWMSDVLSTVLLFLLFVAGEHLELSVHQALHARVKTLVAHS